MTFSRRAALALIALTGLCFPSLAQETRTVTDHAGFEVTVPATPQRVVSLSDWTTTIMAHELGVEPIASIGRRNPDGTYHIRSARELYGLDFTKMELASVHGELDIERIAGLKPDLILGLRSDTINYREQLSQIAPVLMIDTENGMEPLDLYADFAGWLGKTETFEELKADYEQRITDYLAGHPDRSDLGNYLVLRSNTEAGDISVYRVFGAITTVLNDIGFAQHPMMAQVPATEQRAQFSAELVGQMDADYIIAGHMEDRGQTAQTSFDELELVAPGATTFLRAAREGRFISVSRFHVSTPAFAALTYFIDQLEAIR